MVKQSKRAVSAILSLAMFTTVLPPAALAAGDKTLVEGTAVYNEVLGTYEQQFQDSVRFTQDGKTNVTGTEWLADSETVGVNRERAHAQFVPYQDAQTGLAAEKSVLDAIGRDTSDYYRLLSGKNWDFALVRNPAEAAKKDAAYLAENYTGSVHPRVCAPGVADLSQRRRHLQVLRRADVHQSPLPLDWQF